MSFFRHYVTVLLIFFSVAVYADNFKDIKPEQIVSFQDTAFACSTEDNFKAAEDHIANGEKTKFNGMFNDFTCFVIPITEKYKVLSVDNAGILSATGLVDLYLEIVNVNSDSTTGVWTNASHIKP